MLVSVNARHQYFTRSLVHQKQQFARYYHFAHSFTQLVTLGDTIAVQQSRTGDRTWTLRVTMALEIVKFSTVYYAPLGDCTY